VTRNAKSRMYKSPQQIQKLELPTYRFVNSRQLRVRFNCNDYAFAKSGLTDLLCPNSIHFLSGAGIAISSLNTVSFWSGQCEFQVHELFVDDITGRSVVCYFDRSSAVVIESRIEVLCESCFSNCESLTSVLLASNSKLHRSPLEKVT
jgi:hypothetical protein